MLEAVRPSWEDIQRELLFPMPRVKTEIALIFGSSRFGSNRAKAELAADLFDQGAFDKIIVSGGNFAMHEDPTQREFTLLADTLVKRGVPSRSITCEKQAAHTEDNITLALPLGLAQAQSATAICSWPHQRRVLMTMRKYLPDIPLTVAPLLPANPSVLTASNWHQNTELKDFLLREYSKVIHPEANGLPDYVNLGYCVPIEPQREQALAARLPALTEPARLAR